MDQIGRNYGKFILEGIAVLCLTGFLFWSISDDMGNQGMLEILGTYLPWWDEHDEVYEDFHEIYKEESRKSVPEISYRAGAINTGNVNITQLIRAVDYSGRELTLEILSIKNMEGEEMIQNYDWENGEIRFIQAGVYTVLVSATDDGNRRTECRIKIPVNRNIMEEAE